MHGCQVGIEQVAIGADSGFRGFAGEQQYRWDRKINGVRHAHKPGDRRNSRTSSQKTDYAHEGQALNHGPSGR